MKFDFILFKYNSYCQYIGLYWNYAQKKYGKNIFNVENDELNGKSIIYIDNNAFSNTNHVLQ